MTTGNVGTQELNAALNLSDELKAKITAYEKRIWAANLSTPEFKAIWPKFLKKLEESVDGGGVADADLISLIHYLSTQDTASLLDKIGQMAKTRQVRFLELLNWVAQSDPDLVQRKNAQSVRERILMTYRMQEFPDVYSSARIFRAIQIAQSMN